VTLPEVVTGELGGKFGEISLFDHQANFKLGSASNSNSTSSRAIACESAAQPCNLCRARTEAPPHAPGLQGARTRVQLGLRHRPRSRFGLQPPLRLLLGLRVRVRLRVGPRGSRV
jgi:hypothetical protein